MINSVKFSNLQYIQTRFHYLKKLPDNLQLISAMKTFPLTDSIEGIRIFWFTEKLRRNGNAVFVVGINKKVHSKMFY